MIIESLVSNKRNLIWTIFHVLLGIVSTVTPFIFIAWFYIILLTNIFKSIKLLNQKKSFFFFSFFSYLISFEVLDRMAGTSPFIPYELGKYMLLIMGLLGIFFFGIRSNRGLILAILILPALFYDESQHRISKDIISYLLAPLSVGLGLAFADKIKIFLNQFDQILKLIFWTSLTTLIFTIIKTPNLDEIEFSLGANFDTTGGHASNQVSTILGLGLFLSFYSVYNRKTFSGNMVLDIVILIGFTIQGLLSFSRGGMIVGCFCCFILILTSNIDYKKLLLSFSVIIVLYFSFNFANTVTNGNLLLRYQGETQGTLAGSKEKDLNNFVTGRLDIFEKDINIWLKYPIWGAGIGASSYMRDEAKIASHVELSRLLADHGILGLCYSILFFGMIFQFKSGLYLGKNILYCVILFAILTTFHAAMRTYVTPLFIILGSLEFHKK